MPDAAPPPSPFLTAPIGTTLARLAVPGVAASLLQASMGVTEAYFVGQLGPTALASVALVFPIFMLAGMLSAGAIGGAVAGATARAIGAGAMDRAATILRIAMVIALVGAAIMSAVMLVFGPAIFRLLGGDGQVLAGALAYADLMFAGIAAIWLFNMTAAILRGGGNLSLPMLTLGLAAALHVAFSFLFVAPFGLKGAAMALVAAYAVGTCVHLAALTRPRALVRLSLAGGLGQGIAVPLLRSGLTAAAQSFMTVLMALIVTGVVGRLGTAALAGYGIGVRLELLMVPVIFGIGSGAIAMVGANVGANQRARAIGIAWRGAFATAIMIGGIGAVAALHPPLWSELFTADPQVAETTATYLRTVGPVYGFFGLGLALYFASQGLDSLAFPVIGTIIRLAVVIGGVAVLDALDLFTAQSMFLVVALAMVIYGGVIALSLRLGPWRPPPSA